MYGWVTLGHSFFVYARDRFFEEGGARRAVLGRSPGGVAARAGMSEGCGCGGGRRGDIKDGGGCESEEVVGPFLWS